MLVHSTTRAVKIGGAALAAGLLAGCYPAMVRQTPEIAGALTLDGRPIGGADVFVQVGTNGACNSSRLHDVSDEQGVFEVPAERRWELYSPIALGDRVFGWRVCFDYKGRYYLATTDLSRGSVPKRLRLECDLGARPEKSGYASYPDVLCRVQEPDE